MSVEEEESYEPSHPNGIFGDSGDQAGSDGGSEQLQEEEVHQEEANGETEDNGLEDVMSFGDYNSVDVNDQVFEELHLPPDLAQDVKTVWRRYLDGTESKEAAGEAIYAALFDAAPSLQSMFKTPRAVMAMRFMSGLHTMINSLHDPAALKVLVETLGFQHLEREVTIPRVCIFRDAIADLMQVELGDMLTPRAKDGLLTALNYIGGAFIYIRVKYAERLKCLAASWAEANGKMAGGGEAEGDAPGSSGEVDEGMREAAETPTAAGAAPHKRVTQRSSVRASVAGLLSGRRGATTAGSRSDRKQTTENTTTLTETVIPKTFVDMFVFNATVMGFGAKGWMQEIVVGFDDIVSNVANSTRLQEECDVLSLRLAKYKGTITLGDYKSVMLASLRSLVKGWGSLHEVSWSWLWDNVERMLKSLMGKPAKQEASLSAFLSSLDGSSLMFVRREVYAKFFDLAPGGQDYFKQSTTRLHFIADKVVSMTLDMYREPKRMVEDISALGLRHVGYGIPTDLFGPFVTACVQVVRTLTDDDEAEESFRWSLGLVSRILTRVINEGSTIVMRAINANSSKMLKKAVGCASRGKRADWTLNVQVGTQSISPLLWAIETGSHEAARAIIVDLLTIRADRDRYYYGMDLMFARHPDIVKRLCLDAPGLMPVLLDGLIWRSRVTENGQRRVNYYIRHLVSTADGDFAKAIEWITDINDPKLVCHPVVSMVTDLVWSKAAFGTFIRGKTWFLFTLMIFILSQAVLGQMEKEHSSDSLRIAHFACRCFIYLCSFGRGLLHHLQSIAVDVKARQFLRLGCVKVPAYLSSWQEVVALVLCCLLLVMLCLEPILHCMGRSDLLFDQHCYEGEVVRFPYSLVSAAATLCYFILLADLSVLSTRVSAYVLVCGRVLSEAVLFLFALSFVVLAFACSVSCLDHDNDEFGHSIPSESIYLYKIAFGMFPGSGYNDLREFPALLAAIFIYVIVAVIFLINLLIAQLSCAYSASYQDMVGFARLNRGKIVVETMPGVPKAKWQGFLAQLRFDERVEFGEGDIGLAGGMQVFEPASANITVVDMIRRFGGSTSVDAQWPTDHIGHDEEDRFDRLERVISKAAKRMSGGRKRGSSSQARTSSAGSGSQMSESDMGSYMSEGA